MVAIHLVFLDTLCAGGIHRHHYLVSHGYRKIVSWAPGCGVVSHVQVLFSASICCDGDLSRLFAHNVVFKYAGSGHNGAAIEFLFVRSLVIAETAPANWHIPFIPIALITLIACE